MKWMILRVAALLWVLGGVLSASAGMVCEQRPRTGYTCFEPGRSGGRIRSANDRLLNNYWYERFKAVQPYRDTGDIDPDSLGRPRRPYIRRPSIDRPSITPPYIERPYIGRPSL